MLYDACADAFRERRAVLHSFATFAQLASIEGATLRAPEGEWDDRAMAHALALWLVERSIVSEGTGWPVFTLGERPMIGGGVYDIMGASEMAARLALRGYPSAGRRGWW